ncbi:choice-of-anchor X domain-containing protein [Massilia sp. ST3]|uniref:choice-of-anchor X domain-containing protein n=1 Tax=Massilia sp. ST3 TaxID=2824903 RepID=UPI0035A3CAF0
MPAKEDNSRLAWSIGLGLAVLAAALYLARGGEGAPRTVAAAPPPAGGPQFLGALPREAGLPVPDGREERRRVLAEQVRETDQAYCSYLEGSKYPHESQPAARNPDQLYPNQPVTEMNPMRTQGGGSSDTVLLQTSQSRVYLAAGETVAFSLRAVDAKGQPVPLVVTRALAQGMTYGASRPTAQVSLPFADDGGGADPVANDGAFAGVLAPAQTGLAGFHGTIRTEVRYSAGGRSGFALFDVIYTPSLPAAWTGKVREASENGSLVFHLGLDVRQAGRYVVTGRVDDARGKPFALATFNEELGPGPQDVKLSVFGKLLTDGAPQLPLVLRDVDGYLLRENLDPDRLLLPRLEGKVYASKTGSAKGFSDAEWQSEERSRYLAEYGKDRNAARARLAAFDPGQPLPRSACAQPGK